MSINKNLSVEEIIYQIYPDLGRQSRPDNINLHDYFLEASDFCKIHSIPFDVLVKLRKNTECSCSVYFLYRFIRKKFKDNKWLTNVPSCYEQKYLKYTSNNNKLNENNDLNLLEKMCNFDELVNNCKVNEIHSENDSEFIIKVYN